MRVDEENRTIDLAIHYWGPFKSGKSTSLMYIRSRLMKIDFEVDDEPFVPSLVAASTASPMTIMGDSFRTPALSKLDSGFDLHVSFRAASGFPTNVALQGPFGHHQTRLAEADLAKDAIDAIIFVASSAAEDLDANLASLDELATRGLVERTVFQMNKQDVAGALDADELAAKLGIADSECSWFPSVAREGKGVFPPFQHAVRVAMSRHASDD